MKLTKIDYRNPETLYEAQLWSELAYYRRARCYHPDRFPTFKDQIPRATEAALVAEILRRREGGAE